MLDLERRFAVAEYRQSDKGVLVQGTAMPYNVDADIAGLFKERFLPGAFGNVAESDVVANVQHDRGRPLARTGSSGGLAFHDGPTALRAEVLLPDTTGGTRYRRLAQARRLGRFQCRVSSCRRWRIVARRKSAGNQ